MQWTYDPDPTDTTCVADFTYVRRLGDGPAWSETERHTCGLFSRETWLRLLREAGFAPSVRPLIHSEIEPGETEVFTAIKPA